LWPPRTRARLRVARWRPGPDGRAVLESLRHRIPLGRLHTCAPEAAHPEGGRAAGAAAAGACRALGARRSIRESRVAGALHGPLLLTLHTGDTAGPRYPPPSSDPLTRSASLAHITTGEHGVKGGSVLSIYGFPDATTQLVAAGGGLYMDRSRALRDAFGRGVQRGVPGGPSTDGRGHRLLVLPGMNHTASLHRAPLSPWKAIPFRQCSLSTLTIECAPCAVTCAAG